MRRAFYRKLAALLRRGIETGEFRVSDARLAALAIGGMVSWAYIWYRYVGELSFQQFSVEMSHFILQVVKVNTAPAASRLIRRLAALGKVNSDRMSNCYSLGLTNCYART